MRHARPSPADQSSPHARRAEIRLATGERLYVYGREPEIARVASSLTREQAEQLAKDVARALTKALTDDGEA
jgi:hypothetical protein